MKVWERASSGGELQVGWIDLSVLFNSDSIELSNKDYTFKVIIILNIIWLVFKSIFRIRSQKYI